MEAETTTTNHIEPRLTLRETARVLRKSPTTMYRWVKAGRGPKAHRVGNTWRFWARDVREFEEER